MSLKKTRGEDVNQGGIETTTRLAQRQLFSRFVLTMIFCFVVIQGLVMALLIYQQNVQANQMMTSLKAEYQRFLIFESSDELEQVLLSYPEKLIDNGLSVIKRTGQANQDFIAGLAVDQTPVSLDEFLLSDSSWLDFLLAQPYLSMKLSPEKASFEEGKQQLNDAEYWLVLNVPAKLSALIEKWVFVGLILALLSIFISFIVWRLIGDTLQPLHALAKGLDNHKVGQGISEQEVEQEVEQEALLDRSVFSDEVKLEAKQRHHTNKGLEALNQGVNQVMYSLKEANLSMSHTLDAIAHDLRTPLSRILLSTEKALAAPLSDLSDETEYHKEEISRLVTALSDCAESASQATGLLTTLMKINDEAIGRHEIVKENISLKELSLNVISWYQEIAEEKGIGLGAHQSPDIVCFTDPKRLTQILVNLVDNSIKYSEKGDEIQLCWGMTGHDCFISVKDTGIGIEADKQAAIFERLYRVDHSRSQAGYGLGLAMVKVMLDSLNASISVSSELGKGSEFCVLLTQPASQPASLTS
ncbi:HAMP domain-containing sensor histidine kinase [Marinomonas sp. THO17]|uniref:sensor histidine kinase n=1 Tax=Marinomonas sp. THO17 TaxID=3149048 RepID=UPI00336BBAAC